ncbi:hypothetical protein, partial [Streptomyces sp. NPDC006552]|uniref:hypothetical protein n=1 Tax=Streptomyces sp. NPDC006552 TaxID=3157179 RepID=UPI0033B9EA4F
VLKEIDGKATKAGKEAVQFATAQLGKPYVWGAQCASQGRGERREKPHRAADENGGRTQCALQGARGTAREAPPGRR